jgi:hypothetical protein
MADEPLLALQDLSQLVLRDANLNVRGGEWGQGAESWGEKGAGAGAVGGMLGTPGKGAICRGRDTLNLLPTRPDPGSACPSLHVVLTRAPVAPAPQWNGYMSFVRRCGGGAGRICSMKKIRTIHCNALGYSVSLIRSLPAGSVLTDPGGPVPAAPFCRFASVYDGKVIGLPVSAAVNLFYYRWGNAVYSGGRQGRAVASKPWLHWRGRGGAGGRRGDGVRRCMHTEGQNAHARVTPTSAPHNAGVLLWHSNQTHYPRLVRCVWGGAA